jgi:hypothetical protein
MPVPVEVAARAALDVESLRCRAAGSARGVALVAAPRRETDLQLDA